MPHGTVCQILGDISGLFNAAYYKSQLFDVSVACEKQKLIIWGSYMPPSDRLLSVLYYQGANNIGKNHVSAVTVFSIQTVSILRSYQVKRTF